MSKMKPEKSRIKSDILLRVRLLYILFILAGLLIFARPSCTTPSAAFTGGLWRVITAM